MGPRRPFKYVCSLLCICPAFAESVVSLSGTKPDWESSIDTSPSIILCRIFMVVHPCLTLDSCLCPEHHPFSCYSRQWIFARSQLGPCHLYTFGQVGGVNWGLICGCILINMSLTSRCCRATTSPALTITSVKSLHMLF